MLCLILKCQYIQTISVLFWDGGWVGWWPARFMAQLLILTEILCKAVDAVGGKEESNINPKIGAAYFSKTG